MTSHRGIFRVFPLIIAQIAAQGQVPSGKNLAFDVATVKPASPLDMQRLAADVQAGRTPRIGPQIEASRATYTFMSLDSLIAVAYRVRLYQISGPPWLSQQRFDIVAKFPEGATRNDVPAMLKSLLEERFKLVARRAQQEHKVLALIVGKSGIKMKGSALAPQAIDPNAPLKPGEQQSEGSDGPVRTKADPDGTVTVNMGTKGTVVWKSDRQNQSLHLESSGLTLAGYAEMLSYLFMQMGGPGSRQVVDMTGIKGHYQVDVEISLADLRAMARAQGTAAPAGQQGGGAGANTDLEAADPGGGAGVLDSVKMMGLKLEARKATVERLVIDHVEKTPTQN